MEKKMFNVFHGHDVYAGDEFGGCIYTEDYVGTVVATDEEIEEFLKKWHRPKQYGSTYGYAMRHHYIIAQQVAIEDINSLKPYSD